MVIIGETPSTPESSGWKRLPTGKAPNEFLPPPKDFGEASDQVIDNTETFAS